MGDLTKNISRHELECSCGCGFDSMDYCTIMKVQAACNHFASKQQKGHVVLNIHSASRCYEYNRSVGSNDNSQHPRVRAIDHDIEGVTNQELHDFYDKTFPECSLGLYDWGVHIDTRTNGPARW